MLTSIQWQSKLAASIDMIYSITYMSSHFHALAKIILKLFIFTFKTWSVFKWSSSNGEVLTHGNVTYINVKKLRILTIAWAYPTYIAAKGLTTVQTRRLTKVRWHRSTL